MRPEQTPEEELAQEMREVRRNALAWAAREAVACVVAAGERVRAADAAHQAYWDAAHPADEDGDA